jgi:hypothetical protein
VAMTVPTQCKVRTVLCIHSKQQRNVHLFWHFYPTQFIFHTFQTFHTFFLLVSSVLSKIFGLAKLEEGGRLLQGTKPPPPINTNPEGFRNITNCDSCKYRI